MYVNDIIQILTAHEGNGEKLLSRGKNQSWPTIHQVLRAEVNSRPRLNFIEGALIFYHSPNKRSVDICFTHPIHILFSLYRAIKVQNLAAVTASLRVREIVKDNTYGLVSKHEHYKN